MTNTRRGRKVADQLLVRPICIYSMYMRVLLWRARWTERERERDENVVEKRKRNVCIDVQNKNKEKRTRREIEQNEVEREKRRKSGFDSFCFNYYCETLYIKQGRVKQWFFFTRVPHNITLEWIHTTSTNHRFFWWNFLTSDEFVYQQSVIHLRWIRRLIDDDRKKKKKFIRLLTFLLLSIGFKFLNAFF